MDDNPARVIVHEPTMLVAMADGVDGGHLVTVLRSVIVSTDGALYAPVAGLLGALCSERLACEVVEDPSMMFGRAEESVTRLWAECPGADWPHDCLAGPTADTDNTAGHTAVAVPA
jgi:hypothetical protein